MSQAKDAIYQVRVEILKLLSKDQGYVEEEIKQLAVDLFIFLKGRVMRSMKFTVSFLMHSDSKNCSTLRNPGLLICSLSLGCSFAWNS